MRPLRSWPATGVAAGLLALALVGLALFLTTGSGESERGPAPGAVTLAQPTSPDASGDPAEQEDVPTVVPSGAEAAVPTTVEVASVGITSTLDPLGLAPNGEVESPPRWQTAGWYSGGARPGETGPAVIAGHVDSPDGPAVFAELTGVRAGDVITVTDAAGDRHRFRVDRTEVAPRDRFPTRAVYGPTPDAQLRLVTCDGPYVAAAGGYQDNFIVYATAVAP